MHRNPLLLYPVLGVLSAFPDQPCSIRTIAGPSILFSGDGGSAIGAAFSSFGRFRFDQAGNLFVPDARNHRVRKITPSN